tara:strand:- start:39 stop:224 length:186 start_codon:yes stop_codon:yes gene_type:complete
MKNFLSLKWLKEYKDIYKERGFKTLIKEKGWVVALILFLFFLTKGLLWLLIPYLLTKGFLG